MPTSTGYSIVVAQFNKALTEGMLEAALDEMKKQNLPVLRVLRVPGSYEFPLISDFEISKPDVRGLIVLGYIERGETLHGEVMGHVVSRSLVELQLKVKKPIGIGIIGPGATPEQASVRQVGTARAAVVAVKQVADILQTRKSRR